MPGWIEREPRKGPLQFMRPIGAKEGIDNQVGGAFPQIDAAHLRIGGAAMLVTGDPKVSARASVSATLSTVLSMANSRKPKAKAPGVCGVARGGPPRSNKRRTGVTPRGFRRWLMALAPGKRRRGSGQM